MKKLILFLLVFASAKVSAQVYQEMPQYGYRANRMAFDSTLQIPTVCGVPTLKSIVKVNKSGAIAYDSCNAIFYTYNPKLQTWSAVTGGGGGATDTTSLSNRINLKLNISDTASMLSKYLRKIDTTNKFVNSITRTEGKDSIIYFVGANRFAIKDSVGAGSDTAKVVIAQVYNATATTLLKGEVVYLFGSTGNVASVKKANNKQDSTSSKTLGLVRRDIPAGATGFITTQGQIEKLNLGSYAEGDVLWLDSIDGQFTKFKPQAPYHGVFLGIVERANNGNGLAYIKVQNGYELGEIHDVKLTSPINNQVLAYSDTQLVWKNRNIYSIVDTASLSNRINLKQNSALTSYSFIANNTNVTANGTAQNFKDTSGVYTQSPAWNGVAPTTLTATYRWTKIGKRVDLNITLIYTTAGSSNTNLILPLPADAPLPAEPSGATGNSNFMYPSYGILNSNLTTLSNSAFRGGIRKNSGGTGYELFLNYGITTPTTVYVNTTYWTY